MEASVEGADETMQVFGEAFMRLVRERLHLRAAVASGVDGKLHLNLMLTDETTDPAGAFDQRIICSEVITLEVAMPLVKPNIVARNGY